MSLESVLSSWGAKECSAMDVYGSVFHLGEGFIQRRDEPPGQHKANPIIIGHDGKRMHRNILFEDTFQQTLREFQDYDWAFVSGCTYWGRENSARRQSKLCAFIFDLDGQAEDGSTLNNFLSGALTVDAYPVPNFITLSGNNVHLYYVLEEPVSLYPETKVQMKRLKYVLTDKVWNMYTSGDEHPQHQGINQGFRVVGGRTKVEGRRVRAFRLNEHPHSPESLASYVSADFELDMGRLYPERRMSLEEARKRYPKWYRRVVVDGAEPGRWVVKRDLYEWWKLKIREGAAYGHRYFCLMMLAIYGAKCDVPEEDVRRDALALVPYLNGLAPEHPFTEADALSALECLDERYVRFPREDMERLSGISMPANKRNGRPQKVHLAGARAIQKINDEYNNSDWREGNGRKPKADEVREYAIEHPGLSNRKIAEALGVSRNTVNKWLKDGWEDEYTVGHLHAEIHIMLKD